jgi:hypothetical protein
MSAVLISAVAACGSGDRLESFTGPSTYPVLMADGLSTLLEILGPERGWDYAEVHKIAAFFVIRADNRFTIRSSPEFDRLFADKSK